MRRDEVNTKVYALVDLYSFALDHLCELSERPDWIQNVFVKPLMRLGEGEDADSRWILLQALQIAAQIFIDSARAQESIPLLEECMQIADPEDDVYYLASVALIRGLIDCGQEERALNVLIDVTESGIAHQIKREDLRGPFAAFGSDHLRTSLGCAELRSAISKFTECFHNMDEVETVRLIDTQPERIVGILIAQQSDLTS